MTRWFPIAPGTTLGPAPAEIAGQITATKTVPVWNETVLTAARTRTALSVTSFDYALNLLTEAVLPTRTFGEVTKALPTSVIALASFAPSISTGTSVAAQAPDVGISAFEPSLATGVSIAAPAVAVSVEAYVPENIGVEATSVLVPLTEFVVDTPEPTIATAVLLSVPSKDVSLAALAPVEYEPYFSSVSLLLHCDGTDGSTTITDSSSNAFTVTRQSSVSLSTAQAKFGTASLYFDGTDDKITTPSNSAFAFGTGDFTVEFWFYISSHTSATRHLCGLTDNTFYIGLLATNNLRFATTTDKAVTTTPPTVAVWHHVALARSGNNHRFFLNGTQVGSTWTNASNYTANALVFGATPANGSDFTGYLDDIRITKGIARYTANFTVPSAPFPDS